MSETKTRRTGTPRGKNSAGAEVVHVTATACPALVLPPLDQLPSHTIIKIGSEAEADLSKTLGEILNGFTNEESPVLFSILETLSKGIKDADLPSILEKIQASGGTGLWQRVLKKLGFNKENLKQLSDFIQGKTVTLKDLVNNLEGEMVEELKRLGQELRDIDDLRHVLGDQYEAFNQVVEESQTYYDQQHRLLTSGKTQPTESQARKLELLENRVLSLKTSQTQLAAEHQALSIILQSGIITFQEVMGSAGSRFNSIRMTLIHIHGVLGVKNVQSLADQSAALDAQLNTVRSSWTKSVVQKAATMSGENRLQQMRRLEQLSSDCKELLRVEQEARTANQKICQEIRPQLEAMRQKLAIGIEQTVVLLETAG